MGDEGVLGILAADLEDRVHVRVEENGRGGVGGDLVDDPLRHGVQAGNLAARARHAETHDMDVFGKRAQLIAQGTVALARGPHGIAVGPQVDGGHDGLVDVAHEDGLCRRGAHVEPEDQPLPCPRLAPPRCLELHPVTKVLQGLQVGEGALFVAEEPSCARERGRFVFEGPERGSQGLEVGRLVGDPEVFDLLAQVVHDDVVSRRAADDHDVAPGHLVEDLDDLARHHLAQARHDPPFRNPLVGRMGAVALAEDAAAARDAVGALRPGKPRRLAHVHSEALDLLEEELARPRGALVARVDRRDAPVAAQGVDEEGLATGADDGLQVLAAAVEVDEGLLHGLGLGDGGEVEKLAEAPPRDAHPVVAARVDVVQHLEEVAAGVSVVGLDADVERRDPAASVAFEAGHADRGSPDADTERSHKESSRNEILPKIRDGPVYASIRVKRRKEVPRQQL